MLGLVVLFFLISFSQIQAINYTNCDSAFIFNNLTVEGCHDDSEEVCILYIRSDTTVSFNLNSGTMYDQITDLINDVTLIVYGTSFNLTVIPQSPCDVLKCPIEKNYSSVYSAKVHISEYYQPMHYDFKWIMKTNDVKETFICFKFPVILDYYD